MSDSGYSFLYDLVEDHFGVGAVDFIRSHQRSIFWLIIDNLWHGCRKNYVFGHFMGRFRIF